MITELSEAAVDHSVRLLQDWTQIHSNSSDAARIKAAENLLQAVGVDLDLRDYIQERMEGFGLSKDFLSVGGFWIGFVMALLAADAE